MRIVKKGLKTMKWQYVSNIQDENVFKQVSDEYKLEIPSDFITFIKKYNAGTPEKCHIKINGVERIVGAVLSYNKGEADVDSAFLALDVLKDKNLLPFAVDPFGNYFCVKDGKVVFWRHEEMLIDETNISIKDFEKVLY